MSRLWVGSGLCCLAFVAVACDSAPETVPDNFVPMAVSAVDAETFWVLGRGEQAMLAHTTDGGGTFTALPAPDLPVGGHTEMPVTIEDVLFADKENGWIYGNTLWSTHDGGESWTRLDAEDEGVYWMSTSADSAYALVQQDRETYLWRAPANSDEWEQLDLEFGDLYPIDIVAADDLVVIAGGDGQHETAIWVSTDGADTFEQHETDCLPVHSEGELTAVTADKIWLTCPTDDQATERWHVMVSTDHGASWDQVYAHEVDPEGTGASWPMVTARSPGAATVVAEGTHDLVHVAVGSDPEIVEVDGFDLPQRITFATPDAGFLISANSDRDGSQRLLRTTDGGRSWDPVDFG